LRCREIDRAIQQSLVFLDAVDTTGAANVRASLEKYNSMAYPQNAKKSNQPSLTPMQIRTMRP
jgi:hypothetical protein